MKGCVCITTQIKPQYFTTLGLHWSADKDIPIPLPLCKLYLMVYKYIVNQKFLKRGIAIGIANMHKKYRRQDRDPGWLGHIAAR